MADKLSSRLMGLPNTGNGRRESYQHIPMPRMTNTYMLAGRTAGGHPQLRQARCVRGKFRRRAGGHHQRQVRVFGVSEAYLIEDGKVTAPVKNATLIGNGPDVLTRVRWSATI